MNGRIFRDEPGIRGHCRGYNKMLKYALSPSGGFCRCDHGIDREPRLSPTDIFLQGRQDRI